jgi:hypothetical protein
MLPRDLHILGTEAMTPFRGHHDTTSSLVVFIPYCGEGSEREERQKSIIDETENEIKPNCMRAVTPAFAGTGSPGSRNAFSHWIPAFAGMTKGIHFFDLHRRCFFLLS